jgi:hypothetical protein
MFIGRVKLSKGTKRLGTGGHASVVTCVELGVGGNRIGKDAWDAYELVRLKPYKPELRNPLLVYFQFGGGKWWGGAEVAEQLHAVCQFWEWYSSSWPPFLSKLEALDHPVKKVFTHPSSSSRFLIFPSPCLPAFTLFFLSTDINYCRFVNPPLLLPPPQQVNMMLGLDHSMTHCFSGEDAVTVKKFGVGPKTRVRQESILPNEAGVVRQAPKFHIPHSVTLQQGHPSTITTFQPPLSIL